VSKLSVAIVALLAAILLAPRVHADDAQASIDKTVPAAAPAASTDPAATGASVNPAATAVVPGERYGAETIGADLLAVGLELGTLVAGRSNDTRTATSFAIAGGAVYLLGAPVIHALHQPGLGTSAKSLALRIGLPLAGGLLFGALGSINNGTGGDEAGLGTAFGAILGIGLGAVAASVVDAAVLAREPDSEAPRAMLTPLIVPHASAIAPTGGAGLALAGHF